MNTKHLELAARFAVVATACATLAHVAVTRAYSAAADRRELDACATTGARLDAVERLRSDPDAGGQFDVLVHSLEIGVGYDTPESLAPPLKDILEARARERDAGRTDASEDRIRRDLGRAREALFVAEANARLRGDTAVAALDSTLPPVTAACALTSLALLTAAGRRRSRERESIAQAVGCSSADAHAGRLPDFVALHKIRTTPVKIAAEVTAARPAAVALEPAQSFDRPIPRDNESHRAESPSSASPAPDPRPSQRDSAAPAADPVRTARALPPPLVLDADPAPAPAEDPAHRWYLDDDGTPVFNADHL